MPGNPPAPPPCAGVLARLLRDRAGNAMAMAAAALFPLLGQIGGGIDIGRGHISQSVRCLWRRSVLLAETCFSRDSRPA